MLVRRASAADCDELTRIAHAAKRYWGYPAALMRLWKRDLSLSPAFVARHPVYCASRDGALLGFYALAGSGGTRELEHLWIDPAHIGSGVGRTLFRHAVARLREAGARRLRIAADPHAEGFYLRMGARRVGEVPSRPARRTLPLLVLRVR